MGNTTIDGLRVRSAKKPTPKMSKNSGATLGRTTKKQSTTKQPGSKKKPVARSARAVAKDFAQQGDVDWSDLLGQMSDQKSNEPVAKHEDEIVEVADFDAYDDYDKNYDDVDDKMDVLEDGRVEDNWLDDWGGEGDGLLDEFDFVDDEPQKSHKKRRHKNKKHLGRKIVIIVLVLLLGGGIALYWWGDSLISKLTGGRGGLWSTLSAMIADAVPFQEDANGRTNVLVFGTEGYNMDGAVGDGTHDGAQLTDSLMVISFDQDTKDVALISLPRDLKVSGACYAGKINEVYTCNNMTGDNEEAGASALAAEVGAILGLDIQYWAHVNWGSLAQIVDGLGGITVTLDEDVNDASFTGAVIQAGVPVVLDGEAAIGLARARYGTVGGDFSRGNAQQKIVIAIVQKILDTGMDWTRAVGFLNILGDNLRTNFEVENFKSGVMLVSGFNMDKIRQILLMDYAKDKYYLATASIDGISFVVPQAGVDNYSEIQAYVAQMLSADVKVREGATIAVYNATDTYGMASKVGTELEEQGYNVATIGDAAAETCGQQYCIYVLSDSVPETLRALENQYAVTALGGDLVPGDFWYSGVDIVIVIGATAEE